MTNRKTDGPTPDLAAVDALFTEAAELSADERGEFFEKRFGPNDETLRREVESLLAAHDRASKFLSEPAVPNADDLQNAVGREVGSYRLRERIGTGGMSHVYLAERIDADFEQVVAVKLIRRGLGDGEVLRRFRTECRVLAMLEHPNIARMIDGGIHADGTPYLVMEFVDGRAIDRYCREENLTIEQRLELFITVCEVVHFAHKHSTIHRDLKPSNVLIDASGNVKLLDFGIARIIDLPHEESGDVTATGLRVMTPAYASPEQVRGERLSTAADVYSLGALLYVLLTDHKPLDVDGLPLAQVVRVVSQEAPVEPSVLLRRPSPSSRKRNRMGRRLVGDIDTIVMMALRKEAERRYASAKQFAEDVRRHLEHRPVLAQPDTLGYRFKTFTRRNAGGVAFGTLVLLLLVSSAFGGLLLYTRAETARRQAVAARVKADEHAKTADRTTQLLVDLFQSSDPKAMNGQEVTVREVLTNGADRLDATLSDQPRVHARLRHTLGNVYINLGLFEDARAMFERTVKLKEGLSAPLETADSLERLSIALQSLGQLKDALTNAERALQLRETHEGYGAVKTALSRNNVGSILTDLARLQDAQLQIRRAIADLETNGVEEMTLAAPLENLSKTLKIAGRGTEAVELARRVLAIRERHLPPDHPEVSEAINRLAGALVAINETTEAGQLFGRAIGIAERVYGKDHRHIMTLTHNAAIVAFLDGRYRDAFELVERGQRIIGATFEPTHPRRGNSLRMKARLLAELGEVESAIATSRRALELHEAAYGPDHPQVASTNVTAGTVLMAAGRPKAARPYLEDALSILTKTLGPDHPQTAVTLMYAGIVVRQLGHHTVALDRLVRADEILTAKLGEKDQRVATARMHHAIALALSGNLESGRERLASGLAIHDAANRKSHPRRLRAEAHFALVTSDQPRVREILRSYIALGHPTGHLRHDVDFRSVRSLLPSDDAP